MIKLINSISILLVILNYNSLLTAQEVSAQSPEMEAWMEYMTPGTMHEMMTKVVGNWNTTIKFWADPASEPMTSEGTAKTDMILGGRYQTTEHIGIVMGMPMEGLSLMGFDNANQEFTSIWIDNIGTGTSVAKGKFDESTKSIIMDGTMIDPMTGKEISFKQMIKMIDDNNYSFEMYLDLNGKEFKSMEVEYTRQ